MNVDTLLISTKFAPPRIGARFIVRQSLLERLRDAQRCTLTLVAGSAGFGKTILLAQWRQELMKGGAEVAWLSLSHDDKRLPVFCAYLLAALQQLDIPIDDSLLLEGGGSQAIDSVVATVVNGAAGIDRELHLLIDDYHHVEDPWAHRLMQKLLDNSPDNLRITIASRVSPPLNVSRLRVQGEVAEIGLEELPFSLDETRLFFERNLGTVKLSADEIRLIQDITRGWPASVQLIAIMLRNRPQARTMLDELGWKLSDLQAYLRDDVIAHLPAELTEFLERVSICRRFTAGLAAFVTENAQAARLLKRAEDENLLIYRAESDDRLPWYRFHPLFGEFLTARLAARDPQAANELHRRASCWFADHGLLFEAVRHAIQGGDLDFAISAIEHAAPATWSLGYISPMLHLLDRLPHATLLAHPRLYFFACLTYAVTGRLHKAEKWVAQIRDSDVARDPSFAAMFALAEAGVAFQQDDTRRALELLEPLGEIASENRFLAYFHVGALAIGHAAAGRFALAHRLLDANPVAVEDRKNDTALLLEGLRATVLLIEGRVGEAAAVGSAILARSETAYGRRSVCANLCAACLGDAYYELDRIDDAREVISNRIGLLQVASPEAGVHASLGRARLDCLQESPQAALSFLEAQATHYRGLGLDRPEAYMLAEAIRIHAAQGQAAQASALAVPLGELAARHGDAQGYRAEIPALAALAQARLLLHEGRPEQALAHVCAVRRFSEQAGRRRMLAQARVVAALALDDLGRESEAQGDLRLALQAGAGLGLVRTFLDEGPRVGELLGRLRAGCAADDPLAQYMDDLLGRFGSANPLAQVVSSRAPQAADASQSATLTPRECQILGLVAKAMSTKRIAQALNLTPGTVKWNVNNVLAKLQLSSRYDALVWARKQGLIE